MKFLKQHWALLFIGLIVIIYTTVLSYLSIRRHQAFASGYDLANMTETVWQTTQGHIFSRSGVNGFVSRFADHTDLFLVLLAPLYLLYPSPNLLLIVQAFAVGLSALPIYLISRKILKHDLLAIIIALAFLLNPSILWANLYDFHTVLLAIPLLFFAFYFLLIKKWLFFWLAIGFSLLTKEDVGLFVAMLGLLTFFFYKEKKVGALLFLLGATFSLTAVKVIMPLFSDGKQHWAFAWYNFSPGFVLRFLRDLVNHDALVYYRDLLAPYALLPLIALPWILLALPDLFINLTSDHWETKSLVFHYQALSLVAVTIALIYAFYYLQKHRRLQILALISLIYFSLHQCFFYSPPLSYQVGIAAKNFETALAQIPLSATVVSSSNVRPHVINHRNSFNLPDNAYQSDYVAMSGQKPYETQLISDLKNNTDYQLIYQDDPYYLFKKKE